jgi:formiminotetrahydrofolate cyclodeaminase
MRTAKLSDSVSEPTFLELSLGSFLDLVSSDEPAPAGGSVAATTTALAAGLCVKAARLSTSHMSDALDIVAAGESLRDRAATLSQADADAYGLVAKEMRRSREPDPQGRRRAIAEALSHASDAPVQIVEIAAGVVALAARIAEGGNPNLLGDAVTAALLADAGVRSAAALVTINLKDQPGDDRHERVARAMAKSAASAARARRKVGA